MGRVLSIFRQKMDGHNPSEMDIKVCIPRRRFAYKRNNVYSIIGKIEKFLNWENENVYKIKIASRQS